MNLRNAYLPPHGRQNGAGLDIKQVQRVTGDSRFSSSGFQLFSQLSIFQDTACTSSDLTVQRKGPKGLTFPAYKTTQLRATLATLAPDDFEERVKCWVNIEALHVRIRKPPASLYISPHHSASHFREGEHVRFSLQS